MKNIVLGITGSIAAYKAADIANILTKEGNDVHTIMTPAAEKFITPLTLQTLTKNKVHTDMFSLDKPEEVEHIALATRADIMLIAPASADIIAKIACGIADSMLTSVVLALKSTPVIVCPAMNTAMYENTVTQRNINTLREFGFDIVEPREAMLACGTKGKGALADVDTIIEAVHKYM